MNALERYRKEHKLTLAEVAERAGISSRALVLTHCRAKEIPGDAAMRYHVKLGIPLEDLRPDIFSQAQDPDKAA